MSINITESGATKVLMPHVRDIEMINMDDHTVFLTFIIEVFDITLPGMPVFRR